MEVKMLEVGIILHINGYIAGVRFDKTNIFIQL